jgi:hypothetical protein
LKEIWNEKKSFTFEKEERKKKRFFNLNFQVDVAPALVVECRVVVFKMQRKMQK